MSEPTKYVVPTDMLTGEWPGMRVYGDTTRVVTLADALAWVAEAVTIERARIRGLVDAIPGNQAHAWIGTSEWSGSQAAQVGFRQHPDGRWIDKGDALSLIDAASQDESRGHRVFTGAQSVTFDGKPNDPYRPATSLEADAIDAQAAEFLRPLIDSGAIVKSGHARTCGIWRITAAVARCTCKPAATEEVS